MPTVVLAGGKISFQTVSSYSSSLLLFGYLLCLAISTAGIKLSAQLLRHKLVLALENRNACLAAKNCLCLKEKNLADHCFLFQSYSKKDTNPTLRVHQATFSDDKLLNCRILPITHIESISVLCF